MSRQVDIETSGRLRTETFFAASLPPHLYHRPEGAVGIVPTVSSGHEVPEHPERILTDFGMLPGQLAQSLYPGFQAAVGNEGALRVIGVQIALQPVDPASVAIKIALYRTRHGQWVLLLLQTLIGNPDDLPDMPEQLALNRRRCQCQQNHSLHL